MGKLNFREIESKWQEIWSKEGIYSPDIKGAKNPFYNLWMYPYPSAEGLHAGHAFSSTGSDIYGRYQRMNGKNVFQPIGYDSFGIHSENFALKIGEHPSKMLKRTTKHYEDQLKKLGHGYDWTKTVTVSDVDYYRWTQWLFVQLFKSGLAYQKEAEVNFCRSCKTVVADEQVIDGKCERCQSETEKRNLKQWFFRITDYADRLLEGHKQIDWSERVVTAQRNWIGKSEGAEVEFPLKGFSGRIRVFTTRPDTLFGATFLAVSPEYARKNLMEFVSDEKKESVEEYIKGYINLPKDIEQSTEKTGEDTGLKAINPATGEEIPVWVADYVLSGYGSGAIMAVPAHDERDWEFATKFNLPIIEVIAGGEVAKEAYTGDGKIVNSGEWNDKVYPQDYGAILSDIEKKGWGKRETNYHLRDWLISRQRYWGPPIPLVYCEKCAREGKGYLVENKNLLHKDHEDWQAAGWWPVEEKDLPVVLPELTDWKPEGNGKGPLASHPEFYETKCPHCGSDSVRETDVSDTFLDSSWYFLRYPSVGDDKEAFNPEITKKWLPIDLYFGGAEHAVLHLMYCRFVTKALFDLKYLDFDEPAPRFFAHGLMIKGGAKMSKSRGNVVNPDEYIEKFGADTLRLYLSFMGPMDGSPDFRDEGIEGMGRFVGRVWRLCTESKLDGPSQDVLRNQTVKKVTEDIETFKYNTALAQIMIFVNSLKEEEEKHGSVAREDIETLIKLLAPYAPHFTEEVWHEVLREKDSIHISAWPRWDAKAILVDQVEIVVQINGKVRSQILVESAKSKLQEEVEKLVKEDPQATKWLTSQPKKVVFIPGRLINFVI